MEASSNCVGRGPGASSLSDQITVDRALIEKFRVGDHSAFTTLYTKYQRAIYAICLGILTVPQDAEDALQETFVSASKALQKFTPENPKAWLTRIARNTSIDIVRARRDTSELIEEISPQQREVEPFEQLRNRDELRSVLTGLASLTETQRCALLLREVGDESLQDIADTLGLSHGAARDSIKRARINLRNRRAAENLECSKVRETLAEELDGADGRARSAVIRQHLNICPSCAEFNDSIQKEKRILRSLSPSAGLLLMPSAGMIASGGLLARLLNKASKPLTNVKVAGAAAGVVAVMSIGSIGLLSKREGQHSSSLSGVATSTVGLDSNSSLAARTPAPNPVEIPAALQDNGQTATAGATSTFPNENQVANSPFEESKENSGDNSNRVRTKSRTRKNSSEKKKSNSHRRSSRKEAVEVPAPSSPTQSTSVPAQASPAPAPSPPSSPSESGTGAPTSDITSTDTTGGGESTSTYPADDPCPTGHCFVTTESTSTTRTIRYVDR